MKRFYLFLLLALLASLTLGMTECTGDPDTPGMDAGQVTVKTDGIHKQASPELPTCIEDATYADQTGEVCYYKTGVITVDAKVVFDPKE